MLLWPPSGTLISRRKSEIHDNPPKHDGEQEESLKANRLYSVLYRVYTEVPHDLTTVLKSTTKTFVIEPIQQGIPWAERTKAETRKWQRERNKRTNIIRQGSKWPPVAVEEWSSHPAILRPPEVKCNGGWPWRRRRRLNVMSSTAGRLVGGPWIWRY
jgi:hypothetical protein